MKTYLYELQDFSNKVMGQETGYATLAKLATLIINNKCLSGFGIQRRSLDGKKIITLLGSSWDEFIIDDLNDLIHASYPNEV